MPRKQAQPDPKTATARPVIVHVLDEFGVGGMETVALTVIARTGDRYAHRILCLRGRGARADRAEALGVPVEALGKRPGKDVAAYLRLTRRLRALRPAIVHTYNIGALDVAFWARLAGVRRIVHAEHGRDVSDPQGANPRYRWMRRILAPAISRFVPVSADLERWLVDEVRVGRARTRLIYNGIDTARYAPADAESGIDRAALDLVACDVLFGTVGRLDPVKGFDTLIDAFAEACAAEGDRLLGLVIVGDGPARAALEARVAEHGLTDRVRLPGSRDDVEAVLRALDIYVCSSVAEGVALTILEAMASGLPVVATAVGGNPELVAPERTGVLVPSGDASALADALLSLAAAPETRRAYGEAGRARVCEAFSVAAMTDEYIRLYDQLLGE